MEGLLVRAQAGLAQLSQCAQLVVQKYMAGSACGTDIACVCQRSDFLVFFEGSVLQGCIPADQNGYATDQLALVALNAIKQLCTSAAPSLNDNRGPEVIAATVVTTVLAVIAVILRFISRHISAAKFGMDDVMILVALLFSFGEDIALMVGIPLGGYGRHLITLSPREVINFAKLYTVIQLLFAVAITSTKISILFFYLRIFPFGRFRIIAIATGCIMIAWAIALILSVFFGCQPFSYSWDKTIPGGHCVNQNVLAYGITATNIFTDILVLILPISLLWKLQMETSRKLAIIGIFLLGCFVSVACIVRLPLLAELDLADVTWTVVNAGIWINVECNIGIVSACLPTMRPLFNTVWPRLFSSPHPPHHRRRNPSLRLFDEKIATSTGQTATFTSVAEGTSGNRQQQQQQKRRERRGKKDERKQKTWFEILLRLEDEVTEEEEVGEGADDDGKRVVGGGETVLVGKMAIKREVEWRDGGSV